LPYGHGRAQPQEFSIRAETERGTLKPAQIANLEGADKSTPVMSGCKSVDLLYTITAPDSAA
jgi:hypothetical protein